MVQPLCRLHEKRLDNLEHGMNRANASLDRLIEHLLAPKDNTLSVTTKWATIRGGAPWVALLVFFVAAAAVARWVLT